MLGSIALRSTNPISFSSRALQFESSAADLLRSRRRSSVVCDANQRSDAAIPKLEPFNRSRIDRGVKDPPFLQKTENDLIEYCTTLEGDKSYSCWRAYFELKDLEEELPKEDVEKFVRQAGGVKSLIDCVHGITALQKKNDQGTQQPALANSQSQRERHCPIPDGLPKTLEEIEEEEKARMPDSPFTRLLRSKGRLPAWYTAAPDHETD